MDQEDGRRNRLFKSREEIKVIKEMRAVMITSKVKASHGNSNTARRVATPTEP